MKNNKIKKEIQKRGSEFLTGLLTRQELQKKIEERLAGNQGSTNVMVLWKIRGLREFNEVNGHLVGDEQIKKVAQILDQGIATKDLLARVDGTEFLGIIATTSSSIIMDRFKELTALASSEINMPIDVAFSDAQKNTNTGYVVAYDQVQAIIQSEKAARVEPVTSQTKVKK